MKGATEGSLRRLPFIAVGAVIAYLIADLLTMVLFAAPTLPLSYLLANVLDLSVDGVLAVMASAMVVTVGTEGLLIAATKGKLTSGPQEAGPPGPVGLETSSINQMLDVSSRNYVEVFPLKTGALNVYGAIAKEEGVEGYKYFVIEPELTQREAKEFNELKELLIEEMDVDLRSMETREKAEEYLSAKVSALARNYGYHVPKPSMRKLQYYFVRDFIHLGKIEPLMLDPLIEDISCDGANIPIYIWHRDYESIPTNVLFPTDRELDTFVSKLAYVSGKHISLATPLVDASLTDGSRLHLTYGKEVTQRGSTFTLRKFKADPLTIVDLIKYNTINPEAAAYLWYLIEKRMSMLVSGPTASGKTTLLNTLSMFIIPGQKVISIEDSVTGDSEILVNEEGSVRRVRIGPYVDGALAQESVRTAMGHELGRPGSLMVLTVKSGKVVWSRCTALIRHKVAKDFIRVTTRLGKTVEVTADHSLFTLGEDAQMKGISGKDVKVGCYLATPRTWHVAGNDVSFNLKEMPAFSRSWFKAPDMTDAGGRGTQQLRVFATHSSLSIPAAVDLDEDLAFLSGLWLADGFYDLNTVGFSAGHKDIESRLQGIASKLGINLTHHSDGVSLLMNSAPLKVLFESALKLVGDDYVRRVPELFFGATDAVVASMVRGYFTGDGNVSAGEICAESASRELLLDMQTLLLRFGIDLRVGTKRKVGTFGGVGTFRASVVGAAQVARFKDLIGFEQPSQMDKIWMRRKASKYYLDPVPLTPMMKSELKSIRWHKQLSPLGRRVKAGIRRGVVSRETILELAEERPETRGSSAYAVASSDLYFDRVTAVERSTREEFVYDLSVPETGNFIADNLVCHNTPELQLPHENWIQEVSRGVGTAQEITLFDLVRNSLRQRPDIIIVGEIRGNEAFTLFQAISSVSGDTPVLVRENGRVFPTPISGLVDRYYQGDSERVPIPVEGPEVLSSDGTGLVQFYPVRYVLRHRASEIYRLRYNGGTVRATGSHSVFVFDEGCKVVPKMVSDLDVGDIMVSFVGSGIPRSPQTIDAKPELLDAVGHGVVESRPKAECPHCGEADARRLGRASGRGRFYCQKCGKTFLETPGSTYSDGPQSGKGGMLAFEESLPLLSRLEVDETFGRVLGVYLADGCVKHEGPAARVVFTLGTPEKHLFIDDILEFFGRHGAEPSVEERGTYAVYEFDHSALAELFESLCGRGPDEKRIPDAIWTSPRETVDAFISGWTADGRRTMRKQWEAMTSARPDLASSLSWLARLNGRPTSISEGDGKCPTVWISKSQRPKSSNAIPARPLRRLAELLDSTARVHMPKKDARTISKKRAKSAIGEILRNKRVPLGWEASQLAATIVSLIDGSLVAAPVRSKDILPFDGFVYDLSVPGTEAFFGGDSPVALHNTGHGGLSTIHADSIESVFNRLTTDPMNIPRSLVGTTLDCVVLQLKLRIGDRSVRRVVSVNEILGYDNRTNEMIMNEVYKWDPTTDKLTPTGRGRLVDKIYQRYGTKPEEIRRDLDSRKVFLEWLATKSFRSYKEVSALVREFYSNPYATASRARTELEAAQV